MAEDEFIIDKSKLPIVRGQIQRIQDNFGVQVEVLSSLTSTIVVCDQRVNENGGTKVWIRLRAPTEKEYFMAKAKTFILSLPQDETGNLSPQHDYQSSIEQELLKICDDVTPNGSSGVPDAMEQSRSDLPNNSGSVEDEVRKGLTRVPAQLASSSEGVMLNMEMMQPSAGQDESCCKHGVLKPTMSPGAESHDSCYDSDTSSLDSRRNSTTRLATGYHSDVSRTVSDTLAAEHTKEVEDVKCHHHIEQKADEVEDKPYQDDMEDKAHQDDMEDKAHQDDISGNQPLLTINEYLAKVEFAIKLGYTEEQVKLVLQKLGSGVTSNELLCELIKLGSVEREAWQEEDEANEPLPEDNQQNIVEDVAEEIGYTEAGSNLRPVVIDGSNVAMSHGNKEVYSSRGIKLAVDWFRLRGHKEITVFVPQWRKEASRPETPITEQEILYELEKEKVLVFTPARRVGGKRVVCYDDRYIIRLAAENGGIVVSNDNYRDLINESPEFKKVIEERLLMYSFVNDRFMPPDDPLGRHGPNLDTFLSKDSPLSKTLQTICPYAKKCTYGNKCKYYHPERGSKPHRSVVEKMEEESRRKLQEVREKGLHSSVTGDTKGKSLIATEGLSIRKQPLTKTRSVPVGQKTQLARTRSLAPSNLPGYDSQPNWQLPPQTQKPDIQGKAGQKMLFGSGLKVSISSGSDISNPKNTWGDRFLPKEMESQCQTRGSQGAKHPGLRARGFSPQQETDRSQIDYIERQDKPRDHWSYSSSDCTIRADTDASTLLLDGRSGGGHLALAKKLSDEGKSEAEQLQHMSMRSAADTNTGGGVEGRPLPLSLTQGLPMMPNIKSDRSHKKLERQPSLRGAEDPRVQAYSTRTTQHHNNYDQMYYYRLQDPDHMYHIHQPQIGFSNSQAGSHRLCGPSAMQERGYSISAHQRAPIRGHVPICRNASEPLSHYRQPFQEPPVHVLVRQNSSSDPQLNIWDDQSHVDHMEPVPWQDAVDRSNPWATPGGSYDLFGTRDTGRLPYSSVPDVRDIPRSHNLPMSDSLAPGAVPRGISPFHAGIIPSYNQECCSHSSTPCHSRQESPAHAMLSSSSRPTPTHVTDIQMMQNLSDPTPPSATPIEDSRASLYYHLCALFSKETVMSVMSQHPEETDAEKLCTYIIGMNI